MKVMVVDDQECILQLMKDVLEDQGYEVITASNGMAAFEAYRDARPSFTLTDISMPGLTGLELLRQIKSLNPEAAVMLMTGAGSETTAVEALRGGAVNYFNKPVDINELITTLNRYATLAAGYDYENYAAGLLHCEHLQLVLDNTLNEVNHAVQLITNHARAIFPLTEIYTLRFGLYEMVVNAIEHGNLGITYEEKSHALETNTLAELLERRAAESDRRDKRVRIDCELTPEGLACTIKDEGEGFNHAVYSSVIDPASLFEQIGTSLHGRGIVLTRLQFDDMTFNEKGNEVRIFKRSPQRRTEA